MFQRTVKKYADVPCLSLVSQTAHCQALGSDPVRESTSGSGTEAHHAS